MGMSEMEFQPGRHRSFIHMDAAWYGPSTKLMRDAVDSIQVVLGSPDRQGCDYEFAIRWHNLGRQVAPRIEVFDDAWLAFAECADLFAWFATKANRGAVNGVSPQDVIEALLAMGFVDHTERERGG